MIRHEQLSEVKNLSVSPAVDATAGLLHHEENSSGVGICPVGVKQLELPSLNAELRKHFVISLPKVKMTKEEVDRVVHLYDLSIEEFIKQFQTEEAA